MSTLSKTHNAVPPSVVQMADPAAATATQLRNIEQATGVTVTVWAERVAATGRSKHGEIVAWMKAEHGLTHGNANAMAHAVRESLAGGQAAPDDLLAGQYAGAKSALRPIHDALVSTARDLGDDVTVVVQKTAVSLRRARQFAVIEVPSAKRIRLGLNLKGTDPAGRLIAAGGMCTHGIDIADLTAVDDEVRTWLSEAYRRAG